MTCMGHIGHGRSLMMLKDYENAQNDLERAFDISQRAQWPDPELRSKNMTLIFIYLSLCAEVLNKKKDSLLYEQKWIEFQLEEDSISGYSFVFHARRLGENYHALGQFDEAIAQYKISHEALNMIGGDYVELARLYLDYALAYIELREFDRALEKVQSSKENLEPDYINYDDYIEIDKVIGVLCCKQEKYNFAIPPLKRALDQYETKYGDTHISSVECNFLIGVAYKNSNQLHESLNHLKKAYTFRMHKDLTVCRLHGNRKALHYEYRGIMFDLSRLEQLKSCGKAYTNELLLISRRAEVLGGPRLYPSEGEIWMELKDVCSKLGQDLSMLFQEVDSARSKSLRV